MWLVLEECGGSIVCLVLSDSPVTCGLYSPPGFSVHGILQEGILEWVAVLFSRGSFQPRDQMSPALQDSLPTEPSRTLISVLSKTLV